jgi:hypothetical protein
MLKLLVRVAFICNISYVLASLILWLPNPPDGQIVSTVIVMGYLMGLPLNAIVFGVGLVWRIKDVAVPARDRTMTAMEGRGGERPRFERWRSAGIPLWILGFNLVVFCLQFISLIFRIT